MKITFEGRVWQFEDDKVSLQQGVALHYEYGMTLKDWQEGIQELDGRALGFTYWLMLQQNGEKRPLKGLDCNIVEFMAAYLEAAQEEAEAARAEAEAAKPDPTQPKSEPPPPDGPPSPGHASPTATTRTHHDREAAPITES